MDKVMSTIGSEETKSLIEEGIEKAQAAKEFAAEQQRLAAQLAAQLEAAKRQAAGNK